MSHNVLSAYAISVRSTHRRFWLAALVGVALLLIVPAGAALAVPVAPEAVQLTQPDGAVFAATPFGDEWYSGYEYQGYAILLDPSSYWVYAEPGQDGRLTPGPRKAGSDAPPSDLARHLRDRQESEARAAAIASMLAPEVWHGASGTQKVLVILVDFTPSTSRGTTDAQWNQAFFDSTAGVKSVRNFYREASYNLFDLEPATETYGTANDGVIAVTLNYTHPDPYPSDDNNKLISKNALIAADPYINYSSFDTNGNGALDGTELHLAFMVRGGEIAYGGTGTACRPGVWAHRGALPSSGATAAPTLDGVIVGASEYDHGYSQQGEWHETTSSGCSGSYPGHTAPIGTPVHEMGHDIDWPDLYDTDDSSVGVGNWSIMGSGSWARASGSEWIGTTPTLPDAFLKWYQGWLTPTPVTTPTTGVAIPNAAQNPVAYLLGANPGGIDWDFNTASGAGEYFLVENRQQVGFDAGLWKIDSAGNAKGCLIWHIDETRVSSNSANADETRRLVDVEEADGPPQDMDLSSGGNSGDTGDPWPGSTGETAFGAASDPNSNWYDGAASGIAVTNISTAGTGCTVDFSGVGQVWNGSVSTDWNTAGNWTTARIPYQIDNVIIHSGVSNWPNVNAAASGGGLHILDGAHLNATADVTLDVYGDWSEVGSGDFAANAGTVVFRGSAAQTITSGAGSHFNHVQIGNGSTTQTVTAGSDLDVNGNLAIQSGAKLAAGSHTIHVAGNWTDNPLSFAPGTGTVILDGAAQTVQRAASEVVAYSNDMSSDTGWLVYDANGDGAKWGPSTSTTPPNSPVHARFYRYFYSATNAANDWLFSPGFTLQAGVTYAIRFDYGAYNASKPEKLAVYIGAAQNVSAMTTQVFDNPNFTDLTWQQGSGAFTPGSSGTYYVGFYCYSAANMRYPAIDDLVVAALDPDLSFYNLSVAGAGTATLGDNAVVQNNVTVAAGSTLALGTYNLTTEGAVTNNGALAQTQTVNGASAAFLNLKNSAGTVDKYLGATIDPGSSNMGSTTVAISGNQLCPDAYKGVLRCFELTPATPQAAAVTFYYTEAERNGADNAGMLVYHWNGSTWALEGGTTTRGGSGDSQWVRVTGIAAYSPFSLNHGSPLAVTLAAFDGRAMGDGSALLEWQTASEVDLLGFYLYRAASEAGTLVRLDKDLIPSQRPGSPMGASYSFQDRAAIPGTTYYYWIEMIQLDGGSVRYGPVRVAMKPGGTFVIYLPLP